MAITDEDRARIGDLVLAAFDDIQERLGDEATLEDAVLIYEVSYPSSDDSEETLTELSSQTTTHRSSVAGGMATAYALTQLAPWERED